ncbi:TonB-dependent receptor domain-containing protein [Brevundimonas sp. SL130]|uniref:TonB-dependent receptor domain-containing protein n=1 Tax=Brevundimonas sp. SL130 TaxID=2995143 RepID=UPI00226C7FE4|nr:TonB-dependent receptor [Brevundimonas sp. SL130]WAC58316.1 TonB-dependent receptor [Brevundimonas sp. SL130]
MATTALVGLAAPSMAMAQAAGSIADRSFNIPAQPLGDALTDFGQQSRMQISVDAAAIHGVSSPGVSGAMSPVQALSRLLSGTGFTYRINGNLVTLERAPDADGAIQLGAVRVVGATGVGAASGLSGDFGQDGEGGDPSNAQYRTAGTSNYISQDQIQRFRGSSVGDFLSGIPGVLNGENRNSGALDVNIRGMQGQGRVPIVIDGAMQESTVYRGYAGMAGRTYLDPDLIGGVWIEKGPSAAADASGAIGGVVRARTLNAGDIVAPGGSYGFVVRAGLTGNNVKAPAGVTIGGDEPAVRNFNRPDFLDLRGGNLSVAYGYRSDLFDLVAAVVRRKSGNYYAGGEGISPDDWKGGANRFSYDEQVINTSHDNTSYLLRTVVRPNEDHTLDVSFMRYETEHGEMKPSQLMYGTTPRQTTSDIAVDTWTARYRYNPSSPLIDFKADVWLTEIDSFVVDPVRLNYGDYVYNGDKFAATLSQRRGLTLSNTSRFTGEAGEVSIAYGGAYDFEKFGKSSDWARLNEEYPGRAWDNIREGWRRQYSAFIAGTYKPAPWATLQLATRYLDNVVQDSKAGVSWVQGGVINRDEASGWAPIFSAVIEPIRGIQFYGRYAEALRAASPFEGTEGFSGSVNPYTNLRPEHAHNTEIGANYEGYGLLGDDDMFQAKFGWFHNDVTDYITLGNELLTAPNGNSTSILVRTNIPRVSLKGYEYSARYDRGWIFGELSGTEYIDITTCSRAAAGQSDYCEQGMASTNQSWFTGHIPPRRSNSFTLGGRALNEKLELGARYSKVEREPAYEVVDLYGSYAINARTSVNFTVNNLMDVYYVDALSLGQGVAVLPAPGRTLSLNLVARFGDGEWESPSSTRRRARAAAEGLSADPLQGFDGDWTGFYVGSHMDWGQYSARGNTTSATGVASAVAASERVDRQARAATGGLQFGYNRQFAGRWIAGVEVDGGASPAKGREIYVATELDTGRYADKEIIQAEYRYEYNWNASARLRLGQSFGRTLVYGSGGLALQNERQTRIQSRSSSASAALPFGLVTRPYFSEETEELRLGWVWGGGAEIAFSDHVSLKAEYLYSHFGDEDFQFDRASRNINRGYTSGGVTVPSGADDAIGRISTSELHLHTVRFGLNYRF